MNPPATVDFPIGGVWRLGRAPDPLRWHQPAPVDTTDAGGGNRFDSFHGNFGVLYFGTGRRACYAETLARFRVSPTMAAVIRSDWEAQNWMDAGSIPADWRDSRILVQVGIPGALPFVDIAAADTLDAFRADARVAGWLEAFGVSELDLGEVLGKDRRVTRLLAQWVAETLDDDRPTYGGIRYLSRLGQEYECWAVFEGTTFEELERQPILKSDKDLGFVANRYKLTIH